MEYYRFQRIEVGAPSEDDGEWQCGHKQAVIHYKWGIMQEKWPKCITGKNDSLHATQISAQNEENMTMVGEPSMVKDKDMDKSHSV